MKTTKTIPAMTQTVVTCDKCNTPVHNASTCYAHNSESNCFRCGNELGQDLCYRCRPKDIGIPDPRDGEIIPHWLCQACLNELVVSLEILDKKIAEAEETLSNLQDERMKLVSEKP